MKRRKPKQEALWIVAPAQSKLGQHPFYAHLNEILDGNGFDKFVEEKCARYHAERMGRPSLEPGRYFRAQMIGFFEGIDSERGIAWRLADAAAQGSP